MTDIDKLYRHADKCGIDVDWVPMRRTSSLSIPLPDGSAAIALDPFRVTTAADHAVKLAHELGHCETGSFYNKYALLDIRKKHENRADKWAINQLISREAFQFALDSGISELWELAEHFNVTEEFMKKAACYYMHGNLATELYFESKK